LPILAVNLAGLAYFDFTGASLIDCCGTVPEQHGVLLLQNGRIVTIVTEEEIGIPKRQP